MDNLSKLESTSKVVSRSLHEGVYTSLSKINQNGYADWNSSLVSICIIMIMIISNTCLITDRYI